MPAALIQCLKRPQSRQLNYKKVPDKSLESIENVFTKDMWLTLAISIICSVAEIRILVYCRKKCSIHDQVWLFDLAVAAKESTFIEENVFVQIWSTSQTLRPAYGCQSLGSIIWLEASPESVESNIDETVEVSCFGAKLLC